MSTVGNNAGPYNEIQGRYHGITVINEELRAIHDGLEFSIDADGTIAKSTSISFLGITGDKQVHFDEFLGRFSQGGIRVEIFEAPTVTTTGTPLVPICSNFEANTTAQLQVFASPVVSANGTRKENKFFPKTGQGVNVSPTAGGIAGGRVLKRNDVYLFLITNEDTVNDIAFGIEFDWHESEIILD